MQPFEREIDTGEPPRNAGAAGPAPDAGLREAVASEGLPKRERLRGKARLDELFERGGVGKSRWILVRALANGLTYNRAAAIVGKAAGKAVARNCVRRRLRAAYRSRKADLPMGYDLVLLGRKGAREAGFQDLSAALSKAVLQATDNTDGRSEPRRPAGARRSRS